MFYFVLNMSIAASIIGLVVWGLSKIRKFPQRVSAVLWLIPLIRMWFPYLINCRYSLLNMISSFISPIIVGIRDGSLLNMSLSDFLNIAASPRYILAIGSEKYWLIFTENRIERVFRAGAIVWLAVSVILLAVLILTYIRERKELLSNAQLSDGRYLSDKVTAPVVCGILKPVVILPKNADYSEEELEYILLHEKTHIRRLDNLKRLLVLVTACFYWFNPFTWLFVQQYFEALELSCDEAVLAKTKKENRKKEYAMTLLTGYEKSRSVYSGFGGAGLKKRIKNIARYEDLSIGAVIGFIVLGIVMAITLLTNPIK